MTSHGKPPHSPLARVQVLSGLGAAFFSRLASVITKTWVLILVLAGLATAASVHFARRIELDTSIEALLPSDDPAVRDGREISRLFGTSNALVAVVEMDEGMADGLAKEFMDEFAARLRGSPLVEGVEYKLPTLTFKEEERRIESQFEIGHVFYGSPQNDSFLMFVTPTDSSDDVKSASRLVAAVKELEYQARKAVKGNVTGLAVTYTGSAAITLEEWRAMDRNIWVTALASLGFALLLFTLAFKRIGAAVYVGLALGMGILWTVAIARLAFGSLNLMTVAFAAILAGLGIDFGIHLCNRFFLEVSSEHDPRKAIRTTMLTTGEGILFGCLTTALAFYSLILTDFDGAAQFGFLVGTGVVLCALAMLLVLPSLLLMAALLHKKRGQAALAFPGLQFLGKFLEKHGREVAMMVILLFAGWQFYVFSEKNFPEFDNQLENLTSRENHAFEIQNRIRSRFGNYFEPIRIVAQDPNPDEAVRLLRGTVPAVEELMEAGQIMRFECVFKYLPSAEKRQLMSKAVERIGGPERTLNYLLRRLKRAGTRTEEYEILSREKEDILLLLRSGVSLESMNYKELRQVLPAVLFDKFFAHDQKSGDYLSVCYIYPTRKIAGEDEAAGLSGKLGVDGRSLRLVGTSLLRDRLERLIQRQFKFITLYIGVGLLAMLALVFRRLHLVIISIVPLLISLVATITVMAVFDLRLNYMNIVAFPLIIGMGIDSSIHIVFRYFEAEERSVRLTISQVGRGILITSLTTICGFGSLLFTKHNGLISLGVITSVGIGVCLLTSLCVLPGLLMLWQPPVHTEAEVPEEEKEEP